MYFRCDEVRGRIDAYVVQALESRELLAVRAHLNNCANCRVEAQRARQLRQLIVRGSVVVPPPGYLESLPARLASELPTASRRTMRQKGLMAIGMGAVAALILLTAVALRLPFRPSNAVETTPDDSIVAVSVAETKAPARHPTPRVLTYDASRAARAEAVVTVNLIAVEPRPVPGSASEQIAFRPAELPNVGSPPVDNRSDNVGTDWASAPMHTPAVSRWEGQALAFGASAEGATALSRQMGLLYRPDRFYGLAAFVLASTPPVAEVTLPRDLGSTRVR